MYVFVRVYHMIYIYIYIHVRIRNTHIHAYVNECVLSDIKVPVRVFCSLLRQVLSPNYKKSFHPTILEAKMIEGNELRRSSRQRSCQGDSGPAGGFTKHTGSLTLCGSTLLTRLLLLSDYYYYYYYYY